MNEEIIYELLKLVSRLVDMLFSANRYAEDLKYEIERLKEILKDNDIQMYD